MWHCPEQGLQGRIEQNIGQEIAAALRRVRPSAQGMHETWHAAFSHVEREGIKRAINDRYRDQRRQEKTSHGMVFLRSHYQRSALQVPAALLDTRSTVTTTVNQPACSLRDSEMVQPRNAHKHSNDKTTLFPNSIQPSHGIFVENRLRWLLKDGRVRARVLPAPVPWAPPGLPGPGNDQAAPGTRSRVPQ